MGYCDRLLSIDLGTGKWEGEKLPRETLEMFLGGKGVGLKLLRDNDTSKDPFDPGNPLIFCTGPLTGTTIQTSARSSVVTRSPLTGNAVDSHAGGHFGPALRRAGWDYVMLRNVASSPVYILVGPDGPELLDASDLWGKDAFETEKTLRERHPGSKVACIGQAGENLVRFAAIGTEYNRHFGRGGTGAVMGSKKVKALVVSGREPITYHDEERFRSLARALYDDLSRHEGAANRHVKGTMMWIRMGQEIGRFLPTHNFRYGQFEHYESITSETMRKELAWKDKGCYGCGVIQCSKVSHWEGKEMEGPEYETAAYLGSNCELRTARDVAEANYLCDKYGLDTISAGVSASFALECAERGILSDSDNERLRFGDPSSVFALIREMAFREGIGDILAEGTRLASRRIGMDSHYFAMQCGGMELSGVNPLGSYSMGLSLATSDFASHTRFWSASDEMNGNLDFDMLPRYIIEGQDSTNVRNCMVICDFLPFGLGRLAPFLEAATGIDYDPDRLMTIGERLQNLSRVYALDTGRTHSDDTMPPRFFEEESFAGLMEGKRPSRETFESHVQEIFRLRGWDKEGRPERETLERLGL